VKIVALMVDIAGLSTIVTGSHYLHILVNKL